MARSQSEFKFPLVRGRLQNEWVHDINAPDEAMKVYLGAPSELVLGYLNGDVEVINSSQKQIRSITLFGRPIQNLPSTQKEILAEFILSGKENEAEEVISIIQKKPYYLHPDVIIEAKASSLNRTGDRRVEGTLLQIAAMAGAVDSHPDIKEEKKRGLVERMILAGNLSKEEVKKQLKVIISPEAREANEKRNQRVLNAFKKFAMRILKIQTPDGLGFVKCFAEFLILCQPILAELEDDLKTDPNEVITSGFIFDTAILSEAIKWFENNLDLFEGWFSVRACVFWIHGFEKLLSKLSSCDKERIQAGIANLINGVRVPEETLDNENEPGSFVSISQPGYNFYLEYYLFQANEDLEKITLFHNKLRQNKIKALENLIHTLDDEEKFDYREKPDNVLHP